MRDSSHSESKASALKKMIVMTLKKSAPLCSSSRAFLNVSHEDEATSGPTTFQGCAQTQERHRPSLSGPNEHQQTRPFQLKRSVKQKDYQQ